MKKSYSKDSVKTYTVHAGDKIKGWRDDLSRHEINSDLTFVCNPSNTDFAASALVKPVFVDEKEEYSRDFNDCLHNSNFSNVEKMLNALVTKKFLKSYEKRDVGERD